MEREKILAAAGADERAMSMKRTFEREGYRVVGLERAADAQAVVLPMPYSTDGVRIKDTEITLDGLFSSLGARYPALGGRLDWNAYGTAMRYGVRLFDYYENESAQIKNAYLTSLAAVSLALERGEELLGKRVLVCGYGRIGKILCRLLGSAGARVCVAARKEEDLSWIKVNGFEEVRYTRLKEHAHGIRLIFNTVPSKILGYDALCAFGGATLIELASSACCDGEEASGAGVCVLRAAALPGKYYPEAAGKILAYSAIEIIKREGLIT